MSQPPGRQHIHQGERDGIGKAEQSGDDDCRRDTADGCADGAHPSPTTISGSGARLINSSEIAAPEVIEANIKADARPAASAIAMVAIISCPAPFERLEVSLTPTIGNRTTRKPYE